MTMEDVCYLLNKQYTNEYFFIVKVWEMPLFERSRAKIKKKGASAHSDAELLAGEDCRIKLIKINDKEV